MCKCGDECENIGQDVAKGIDSDTDDDDNEEQNCFVLVFWTYIYKPSICVYFVRLCYFLKY